MRISDWSSDVCSSDLLDVRVELALHVVDLRHALRRTPILAAGYILEEDHGVAHAVAGANDNQLHVADAAADIGVLGGNHFRSEERRVGKEGVGTCRSRWSTLT